MAARVGNSRHVTSGRIHPGASNPLKVRPEIKPATQPFRAPARRDDESYARGYFKGTRAARSYSDAGLPDMSPLPR